MSLVRFQPHLLMKNTITMVDVHKLISHERVNHGRLIEVRTLVRNQGVLYEPVIVDRESNVILDGHHRVQVLRELGVKRVPVCYVNYRSPSVRVYFRRKKLLMDFIKRVVIEEAKRGALFPFKTTRHILDRQTMKAVPLSALY